MPPKHDTNKRRLENSGDGAEEPSRKEARGGLGAEIHPLLRDLVSLPTATVNKGHKKTKPRDKFDAASLNPYLNQSDVGAGYHLQHRRKQFQLNPKGRYIAQGDKVRAEEEVLRQKELERKRIDEKGLLPDINVGEEAFRPQYPPLIEWWDRPFLHTRLYEDFKGKKLVLDDEEAPVSIYVQHPVPVPPPWEPEENGGKPMFLTKKEMKRKRRNERQARHQEKQDRIRLGLDPPPPPKVKLSNLMNVLTNEAIQDPTGVEMRVKKEVEERERKHFKENEERKLTAEQRHEKVKLQHQKDQGKGLFTSVYKIRDLSDPQQYFKVDINAKQLELNGIILKNPKFNLVIIEGGAKGISFYNKLMGRRIKWTQAAAGSDKDLSQNKCKLIWEGQLTSLSFKKWSTMYTDTDDQALEVLLRFGLENYWREACNCAE